MNLSSYKSLFEKIIRNEFIVRGVSKIMAFVMRFSYYTTRWIEVNREIPDEYHKQHRPFIVCHWHDRLMLTPCVWKWERPLYVLASRHRDGQLIAKIAENFSMIPVYGSTGNGMAAARTLIKLIKKGNYIAIIPDGPTGPRHKVAPGAVTIAKLTETSILPYSFCVKRYFRFNSWDRFIWIWPFNRGVMVWCQPITFEEISSLQLDDAMKLLEDRINEATRQAKEILYKNDV